ncbi:MAG: hypothetical protein FJ137_15235 [Deltaproteobacteria bacterium]|nr:hypothetical protein [Deltaproteobacteria bacterium]
MSRPSAALVALVVLVALAVLVVVAGGCLESSPPGGSGADGALATGTAPNDVALTTCDGARTALVAASADARVDVLGVDADAGARAVFLGAGANPWSVAPAEGGRAVVTLFSEGAVALVDACGGRDLDRAAADVVVDVAPITLPAPVDADGDGDEETTVTRLRPRTPQGVVVAGDVAFVTYTNVLAYAVDDAPMQTGPGVVARFVIDGDRLTFDRAAVLGCENPQGVALGDDDDVIVACTGRFVVRDGAHRRVSQGALVRLGRAALDERAAVAVDASPGTPTVWRGDVVVGDVLDGRVLRFDRALALQQATPAAAGVESIFNVAVDADGRLLAARFGSGEVLVDPFGSAGVVRLQAAGPTRGLIDVVTDGDDLFGLFSLSGELVRGALP